MFGKKKEPKKSVYSKLVMHKNGLSNFMEDTIIDIIIDEPSGCIIFKESSKNECCNSATLKFEKIIGLELGEKGNVLADSSTSGAVIGGIIGGSTGAIIGSTTGKKANYIPALKIRYRAGCDDDEKEINLYQCNYHSDGSIRLIKMLIEQNIIQYQGVKTHVEL